MHNFADRFSKFSGVKLARDYRSARIDLWTEKEDGERSKKNYNQCAGYIIDCSEIEGMHKKNAKILQQYTYSV